jgi:hypothetical protein
MDQRKQFEQQLIEKAMKDTAFRQKLLNNPKEVIEAEFGRKIPESVQVNILEEDSQTVYLILPRVSDQNSEMELTETELNAVAGGAPWSIFECASLEGPCS